jgi:hypothetical protein
MRSSLILFIIAIKLGVSSQELQITVGTVQNMLTTLPLSCPLEIKTSHLWHQPIHKLFGITSNMNIRMLKTLAVVAFLARHGAPVPRHGLEDHGYSG